MIDILEKIDKQDLIAYAPGLSILDLNPDSAFDLEAVADSMVRGGPVYYNTAGTPHKGTADLRPPKKYWAQVKAEFYLFLCTDDPKYDELRSKLKVSSDETGKVALATLAGYFGSVLGAESGVIIGLLSVCIFGSIKLGREAYCAVLRERN